MEKIRFILSISIIFCLFSSMSMAQNVGISNTGATPNASAMLDVSATNKGVLITRVSLSSTTDVATIANPATSLLVYNTNAGMTGGGIGFYYWNGSAWTKLQDSVASSGGSWSTTGNNISNNNTGNVGIKTAVPLAPLHVTGQQAVTVPNGGNSTAHITTLINDIAPATGTDSKIGLYSSVENHATTNVGILTETISTNNANNYGVISSVSNDPGPTGSGTAIAAVDLVKSPDLRTFALKIDGKAQYAGVPNANVTGSVLTNAGDGLMRWEKQLPTVFLLSYAIKDTIYSNDSKKIRFDSQLNSSPGDYNLAGNYNFTTGELTITEAGFYHLTLTYDYWMYSSTNVGRIYSAIKRNGMVLQQITQKYIAEVYAINNGFGNIAQIANGNQFGSGETFSYSTDTFLEVGDVLTSYHENDTDGNQYINLNSGSFTGFKVR